MRDYVSSWMIHTEADSAEEADIQIASFLHDLFLKGKILYYDGPLEKFDESVHWEAEGLNQATQKVKT